MAMEGGRTPSAGSETEEPGGQKERSAASAPTSPRTLRVAAMMFQSACFLVSTLTTVSALDGAASSLNLAC